MKKENNNKTPLGGKVAKIYIAGKVSGEPIAQCSMKFGIAQKDSCNKIKVLQD